MCWLAGVSRAGYCGTRAQAGPDCEETELRDAIQRVALPHRHSGYRRITAGLRAGW